MDCEKIFEIYNESCNQTYGVSGIMVNAQVKIGVKNLALQADKNCLESMKMLDKYCKNISVIGKNNKSF
jgi:hypothetical protein